MAVGINGSADWQIQPLNSDNNSNLAGAFWDYRSNYLKSANDPLRYQIIWTSSGITEGEEPSKNNWTGATPTSGTGNGDVIAVTFKVEATVGDGNWEELASIKKTRDIANRKYNNGSQPDGHRFTVDISQLVSGELSYSLCPINKGTWQSPYYGGMNGGLTMQDNVLSGTSAMGSPISDYNVSRNGTFRAIKVTPYYEIINGNGDIVSAGNGSASNIITVINSVNQFEKDSLYYNTINATTGGYLMTDEQLPSIRNSFKFLSRCKNTSTLSTIPFKKPIRVDEEAEFLQFFIFEGDSDNIGGSGNNSIGSIGLKIETFLADGSAENTFYVREFEDNATLTSSTHWAAIQELMFIQNISPYFINNTAATKTTPSVGSFPYWNTYSSNKITTSTSHYRVSVSKFALNNFAERRCSEYRYYNIDREDEKIPYDFVRFHWLNSMGGIDSYTAKRDVVEGLAISRDVIERKSGDRTWYQDNENQGSSISTSSYISDTMRGGDIYKGGREVSNVNAERNQSVYTEPLNKSVAKWLEEMILSPNVWTEMDTEATEMGNLRNPYLRPSTKEYIPVIITNSDIETVNQEAGLVKFNIEYTLAHKVITQRN